VGCSLGGEKEKALGKNTRGKDTEGPDCLEAALTSAFLNGRVHEKERARVFFCFFLFVFFGGFLFFFARRPHEEKKKRTFAKKKTIEMKLGSYGKEGGSLGCPS